MRILTLVPDASFDLVASGHALDLSQALLLAEGWIGVVLVVAGGHMGVVLLSEEVRSRVAEISVPGVPHLWGNYLSTTR